MIERTVELTDGRMVKIRSLGILAAERVQAAQPPELEEIAGLDEEARQATFAARSLKEQRNISAVVTAWRAYRVAAYVSEPKVTTDDPPSNGTPHIDDVFSVADIKQIEEAIRVISEEEAEKLRPLGATHES